MKPLKILALGAAILFAVLIAFVIYTAQQAHYYQSVIGSALNHDLGFQHGSPYFILGDDSYEVFTLHPQSGSIMSAAGVHDSDIVLGHSITDFYRALHEHRGSTITFRVTDGGDGIPIAQRPTREITLHVPAQHPIK